MHCAACAQTIQKALSKLEGVRKAQVNFATETAYVDYDDDQIDEEKLKEVIRNTGYDVAEELKMITLRIGGMTCASCAQIIARTLRRTEGIKDANVNLATEKATVIFYPSKTSYAKIKKAIDDTGYQVLGREDKRARSNQRKANLVSRQEKSAFSLGTNHPYHELDASGHALRHCLAQLQDFQHWHDRACGSSSLLSRMGNL